MDDTMTRIRMMTRAGEVEVGVQWVAAVDEEAEIEIIMKARRVAAWAVDTRMEGMPTSFN